MPELCFFAVVGHISGIVSQSSTRGHRELLLNAPCLLATKPQRCSLLKLVQKYPSSVHAPDLSKTIRLRIEILWIHNECPKDIPSVAVVNVLGIVLNASACTGLSSPSPNWTYSLQMSRHRGPSTDPLVPEHPPRCEAIGRRPQFCMAAGAWFLFLR